MHFMMLSWVSCSGRALSPYMAVALSLTGVFCGHTVLAVDSVLTNPTLTISAEQSVPDGWQLSPAGTALTTDTVDVPKGVSSAVRLVVGSKAAASGQLMQRISIPADGGKWILTGYMKSDLERAAYIEVKLFEDRRELLRMNGGLSDGAWKKIEIKIDTQVADKTGVFTPANRMEVLCRWYQDDRHVGGTVWFAGLALREWTAEDDAKVAAAAASITATLRIVPTYENASVYVQPAAPGLPIPKIKYREKGAPNWIDAHPLSISVKDPAPRGSLLGLRQNTSYEVRCERADGSLLAAGEFKTWADVVPIARTVLLSELAKNGGPVKIEQSGTADGWIRYVGSPDFVINGGEKANEALLVSGVSYVIIEGVMIKGGWRHGIQLKDSDHVRIRNCDISGFGRIGVADPKREGQYFLPGDNKPINWDAGVYLDLSSNVTIENNFIHTPRNHANSWFYGHPAGPTAVLVRSKGNLVIRYNDFVGGDQHRWNDVIEGYGNEKQDGGFNQDADIYGNYLAYGNDDGVELDGGQTNVRLYGNKIEGVLCGISTAPNFRGPSYIFNNLVVNLGDERGAASAGVKNGGGPTNSHGKQYFYHNTFFTLGHGLAAIGYGGDKNRGMFRGDSFNNLYATSGMGISDGERADENRYDHDVFASSNGGPGTYDVSGVVEPSGVKVPVTFVDATKGQLNLSPVSEGRGVGIRIPGLEAWQPKQGEIDGGIFAAASLPLRRTSVTSSHGQIFLTSYEGKTPEAEEWVINTNGLKAPTRFRVLKNGGTDWLKAEPSQGILRPGKETRIRVSLAPKDVVGRGLLSGALILKLADGESLPVSVYGLAAMERMHTFTEAETLPGHDGFEILTDSKALGGAAVRLVDKAAGVSGEGAKALRIAINAPKAGAYYVAFRVRCQKPYGLHDSMFTSLNGSTPLRMAVVAGDQWQWCRLVGSTAQLDLNAGENEFRLIPREEIELDAVLVSTRPLFAGDELPVIAAP